MTKAVLKGAGYSLIHTPNFLEHLGTTQTTTKKDSDYIINLKENLRSYDEVVNYLPNQVYIGNLHPDALKEYEKPFCTADYKEGSRYGQFGEIMPEDDFILLIKCADAFNLVLIEESFLNQTLESYKNHPLKTEDEIKLLEGKGSEQKKIDEAVENGAEGIYFNSKLVGCVKKAHDIDQNLSSHVMIENLIVKASSVVALKHLLAQNKVDVDQIGYVMECSEEACGDMNQRGGGNFAKAIAEMAGIKNAGGCDIRAFCAAPTHTLIHAASLVESGVYDHVVVVAGGATAKLGMNGRDHVKKGYPILEDVLGTFALLVSKDDGVSPTIRTDIVGTHKVGTGSSPQVVIKALVEEPLKRNNLQLTDVDKYSVEMQNPDLTSLAGAGDVPLSNYKMIGALAVMNKEIERKEIMNFVDQHGMIGWAPTQGHIPSGVPYCGHLYNQLTTDTTINRAMIIGKGSLFLGRMTNLFDGISVAIERNTGSQEQASVSKEEIQKLIAESMRDFASSLLGK
ncbi:glycine/sarcosine/betaine reductase complex component C subunit beta [Haloplasma contractile]|uniref:Glycine reductase complex component C beta subunit protein n=1 Tax=Haloplasma contractile SSD-17B TaxID=1033810 RepID=U2FQ85_9MOLU|nr:glycine/sarcosine/betaine reductase complex component C subunit beta [Haloplasma contractile]ERJ13204.1 Glycine reductase complex component C beta subunit protein [Haloplasma contractile SSD-17B]